MKKVHYFAKRSTFCLKEPTFCPKEPPSRNFCLRACNCCHLQPYLSLAVALLLLEEDWALAPAITLHSSGSLPRVNTISLGQTLSIKNLDPVADASTVLIYESDYPLRATPCSCKSGISMHVTHDSNIV